MKVQRVELKVDVQVTEVISEKIERIAALLVEANAILNDVAKNSKIELDIKSSNQISAVFRLIIEKFLKKLVRRKTFETTALA